MNIYMIKHYWKDGENATWECHGKIDKKLFKYVKENYHNFKEERPTMIKEDNSFIYLCYEDTIDFANRPITNMTFFISRKQLDYDFCKEVNNKSLELVITQKANKFWIVNLGVLLIVGGIYYNSFHETSSTVISHNSIIQKYKYGELVNEWNDQLQHNTDNEAFMLKRDKNNTAVINQLNLIMKSVRKEQASVKETIQECGERKDDGKVLGDNCTGVESYPTDMNLSILFTEEMTGDDIEQKLKTTMDVEDMSSMVKKVWMMNDIEVWKESHNNNI